MPLPACQVHQMDLTMCLTGGIFAEFGLEEEMGFVKEPYMHHINVLLVYVPQGKKTNKQKTFEKIIKMEFVRLLFYSLQ